MKNLKEACTKLIHHEKFVLSSVEFLVLKDIIKKLADDPKTHPDKLKEIRARKKEHKRYIYSVLRAKLTEEEHELFKETFPDTLDRDLASFLVDYVFIKEYFLGAYDIQYKYTASFLTNELTQQDVVYYKMAADTLKDIFRLEYNW